MWVSWDGHYGQKPNIFLLDTQSVIRLKELKYYVAQLPYSLALSQIYSLRIEEGNVLVTMHSTHFYYG